ncbi:MAG: 3'-5' exonuclease, partial [Clostridia bacterium]
VSVEQNSLLDGGKREKIPYFEGNTYVVFDLETTGLNIENSEIIEIAACKVVDGNVTETFQTLVNPETSISAEISNITNITDDMVANSPVFNAVLPDFYKFTRDAVLVGHNIVSFDFPFITKYAEKVGYNFDNDLVDTLTLAQKYLPECKVKKLEALTKKFGISHANAHRAMADV